MALKISLKPNERIIVGGAVVRNGSARSDFIVENSVPILREKDILSIEDADSPCKRIYFVVQLMYVDEKNIEEHRASYWKLVKDITGAAPSTLRLIDQISDHILHDRYYQALKQTKLLIDYEQEVMNHVRCQTAGSI